MLARILVLPVALCPLLQDEEPPANEKQRVETAALALEKAFDEGDSKQIIDAIRKGSSVIDPEVIEWISRGLDERDPSVQSIAVQALRYMDHPEALKSLHGLTKKRKKLGENLDLNIAVLKAIGQHGDESSIEILKDTAFAKEDKRVIQARILALGNIRSNESLDALFQMLRSVGRKKLQPFMKDFRLSLLRLTGLDHGESQDLWWKWWSDNKKSFVVALDAPPMPEADLKRWNKYWNLGRIEMRKKRRDRGEDT